MRGRSRGRRSPWFRTVIFFSALILGGWAAGLIAFSTQVPSRGSSSSAKTDAIVVLTGGSGRLRAGLDLLLAGQAGQMFISGVYRGVDVTQLLAILKQRPDEVENRISIGNAVDTIENALETRIWMQKQGFRSLRLVTAAYHMPRSLLEFESAMPDIRIEPHPVFPEHVKQEYWWAWPGTMALMASEYNKYLVAWLRHRVKVLDLGGSPAAKSVTTGGAAT
ncbi:MAG: YdcF family protein [Rhodospirillales bacterium]|nr:YdcF family protein [Rhodospirillales bacterium]MBO6785322.1 YdcF family protein [Rhodospirillales bacterium]